MPLTQLQIAALASLREHFSELHLKPRHHGPAFLATDVSAMSDAAVAALLSCSHDLLDAFDGDASSFTTPRSQAQSVDKEVPPTAASVASLASRPSSEKAPRTVVQEGSGRDSLRGATSQWSNSSFGVEARLVSPHSQDADSLASLSGVGREVTELFGEILTTQDGDLILCDYEIITELGRGNFGTVHLAVPVGDDGTGDPVAIKTLHQKASASLRATPDSSGSCRAQLNRISAIEQKSLL